MTERYFELSEDLHVPGRWHLGQPVDQQGHELEDPWMFRAGRPVRVEGRLQILINEPGRPVDFSLAGLSVPVVHVRTASVFADLAPGDVQLLPIDIEGQPEQYSILVATKLIRCIDDQRTEEVRYWAPEHGQPHKVGEYRDIWGMRIDPTKVGDARVFRTWGWDLALIVSEDIKKALEHMGATGMKFTEV